MNVSMKLLWENLHKQSRFRPKYPSELVVQYIFRNFTRDGKTRVLDLGCGAGRHVFFMASENIDTYGIDISADGIEHTEQLLKAKGLEANLKVASAGKIPYDSDFFDGIVCYGVLYYCKIDEIKNAVKEIYRVLKPNGKALILVRSTGDYRFGKGKEIEKNTFLIEEKDQSKSSFNENGMVMHFFNQDEIEEYFRDFSKIEINKTIETHDHGLIKDENFIITLIK